MRRKYRFQATKRVNSLDRVLKRFSSRVASQRYRISGDVATVTVLDKPTTKFVTLLRGLF